jgi:hypothetical protein
LHRIGCIFTKFKLEAFLNHFGAGGAIVTSFVRVQTILDSIIADWSLQRERPPNLRRHGMQFGWRTKDELLQSTAFGKQLIAPEVVSNKTGETANLITALRTGVTPFPRMPMGGPFVGEPEILEIIDWINCGTPD